MHLPLPPGIPFPDPDAPRLFSSSAAGLRPCAWGANLSGRPVFGSQSRSLQMCVLSSWNSFLSRQRPSLVMESHSDADISGPSLRRVYHKEPRFSRMPPAESGEPICHQFHCRKEMAQSRLYMVIFRQSVALEIPKSLAVRVRLPLFLWSASMIAVFSASIDFWRRVARSFFIESPG